MSYRENNKNRKNVMHSYNVVYSHENEQTSDNLTNTVFGKKKESEKVVSSMVQSRQSVRIRKEVSQKNTSGVCASIRKHLTSNVYMLYADKCWQKQQSVGLFNELLESGQMGQSTAITIQQSCEGLSHHPLLQPTANTAVSCCQDGHRSTVHPTKEKIWR